MNVNRKKAIILTVSLLGSVLFFVFGCQKEKFQSNASLKFSSDTVSIDTIITQLGTITKRDFKVYNPYNKSIRIKNIKLAKGANSDFIINVNGMGVGEQSDIEIKPNDSLYIFIQAKLKKNNVDTLVIHEDKLQFTLDESVQEVTLIAWGRDATFYSKHILQASTTWAAGTSVMIFDSLIVPAGQTLTIEAGAMVLFKPKANLVVYGTFIVNGTLDNPVIFEGYRLQYRYQHVPGQWGSIILGATSSGNTIKNALIRNGTNGFSLQESTTPIDLNLENVTIDFMSYAGLLCYGAKIKAANCVISNCSYYALKLNEGGSYEFTHITVFCGSAIDHIRNNEAIYINNYKIDGENKLPKDLLNATFQNSILSGINSNEFKADKVDGALFNVKFVNSILKQKEKNEYMDDKSFILPTNKNYKLFIHDDKNLGLDSASIARDTGDIAIANLFPKDIKGRSRIADGKPDIGAYEYFKDTTKVKK